MTEETFDQLLKRIRSNDELLPLGLNINSGLLWVTEGEREANMQIIGSPAQGKSKFLEYLLRHDIDRLYQEAIKKIRPQDGRSCGLCFIDGSDNGDTAQQILSYCAQIGFKRVFLWDPHLFTVNHKYAPVNPFNYDPTHIENSIATMKDTFRVLFGITDPGQTAFIERYSYHLFNVLHRAKMTLYDSLWWTDRDSLEYRAHREFIYQKLENDPKAKDSIIHLKAVFVNDRRYERFITTIGRISTIFESTPLKLAYSSRMGVEFERLITGGFVTIINMSRLKGLQARLFATVFINKLIETMERLRDHGHNKPYFLYIDEAGDYTTRKVAEILDKKRKSGFRFVFAHQRPGQFEDKYVKDAIENDVLIKIAFYIGNPEERAKVIKLLGYSGNISEEVNYALSTQEVREAAMRILKQAPKVATTPLIEKATGNVHKFVQEILARDIYLTEQQIEQDYAKRFTGVQDVRPEPPKQRKVANSKTTRRTQDKGKEFFDD